MKNKGFTLAELLIVIAIIGILASLVLPRMFGPTEQSRSTEARNMMGVIRQAEEAFRNGPQGAYLSIATDLDVPADGCNDDENGGAWQRIGLGDPNANANSYFTYCVAVNAAAPFLTITATRTNLAAGADAGSSFTLDETGTWADGAPAYSQRPLNPDGS